DDDRRRGVFGSENGRSARGERRTGRFTASGESLPCGAAKCVKRNRRLGRSRLEPAAVALRGARIDRTLNVVCGACSSTSATGAAATRLCTPRGAAPSTWGRWLASTVILVPA